MMGTVTNETSPNSVLIIEDDFSQLKTLADIIESEGYTPVCCQTDMEAFEAIKSQELHVAILDLRLGNVDGMTVLKRLKENYPDIRVIINTAYASLESAMNAVNEEAFAYVTKMDDVDILLSHVRRAFHEHLVKYTETLEKEVDKRTKELTIANEKLKREIKDHKKTEKALQKMTDELARSNAELEDFAYIASHDIQEPLHTIQAFCDLIITKYSKGLQNKALDYLNRMQKGAERMHKLIDNILVLSRVHKLKIKYVQVDFNEIVKEVLSDYQLRIQEIGAKVKYENLPLIEADPIQIHQLFTNLIGNSLKFHNEKGKAEINIYSEDVDKKETNGKKTGKAKSKKECKIIIKDNGIGFSAKDVNRIFQPFERLHGTSSYEGSGMGLAICQGIIERHNGKISASSKLDVGTTITITLPYKQK